MSERIHTLRQFITEDPHDPFNYYALALELKHSAPAESKALLLKLSLQFPDYLPSYYQLAILFEETKEHDLALEYLQKGIAVAVKQNDRKTAAELKQLLSQFQDD